MAIFRNFRHRARLGDEDVATLHFIVIMDEDFEERVWGALAETHLQLEDEIRENVSSILGPEFTVSRFVYSRGSIEILVGIGAATYALYLGVSRYKNFVESLGLLLRQVRNVLHRFFGRFGPAPVSVTGTWIPGPGLQAQALRDSATELSAFKAVLWYLIISHAALLGVLIWRVLR